MKTETGVACTPWIRRLREMPAKSRITGETDGIIMAIIMTIHMMANPAVSPMLQDLTWGIAIPR